MQHQTSNLYDYKIKFMMYSLQKLNSFFFLYENCNTIIIESNSFQLYAGKKKINDFNLTKKIYYFTELKESLKIIKYDY